MEQAVAVTVAGHFVRTEITVAIECLRIHDTPAVALTRFMSSTSYLSVAIRPARWHWRSTVSLNAQSLSRMDIKLVRRLERGATL